VNNNWNSNTNNSVQLSSQPPTTNGFGGVGGPVGNLGDNNFSPMITINSSNNNQPYQLVIQNLFIFSDF
jgi:hypothetical protein